MKPSALIQLSGGIDSAYVLWKWLKDNPDKLILVHHIHLINWEGRALKESFAVKNILTWLNQNGLSNFVSIESTFDYGGIYGIIKDVEVCNFFIGCILRAKRWETITDIYMPLWGYPDNVPQRFLRADKIRRLVSNNNSLKEKANIQIHYPLHNKTKKDIIAEMPKELLHFCWYCRNGNGIEPCGKCITCAEVNS